MAKQIIQIGSQANDHTGDPLRVAFTKINQNFTELYDHTSTDGSSLINGDFTLSLGSDGVTTLPGPIRGNTATINWTSNVTGIALGTDTIITLADNQFGGPIAGRIIIAGVVGTTQANDTWYYQAWSPNELKLFTDSSYSTGVDSTSWTAYISGGTASDTSGQGVTLQSNNFNWVFNNEGNFNVPGNVVIGGSTNNNGNEQHLIIDSSNYWTSIQWKNFSSPQDPGNMPFECQAQLMRVFGNDNTVTSWCNVQNPREELVAVTVVRPNNTTSNSLMFSTSDIKIPDAPYNDGFGTRYDWILGGDGGITFPNQHANNRTGYGDALMFTRKTNAQKVIGTQDGVSDYPTVSRLVIAGGDSYFDRSNWIGEGGDIYLWAGRGADGGDIKVDAGNSLGLNGEQGGDIKIRGGSSQSGNGGFLQLYGGYGNITGGYIEINAGNGAANGGNLTLSAGYGPTQSGYVTINTTGNSWTFNPDGSVTLPNNTIKAPSIAQVGMSGSTGEPNYGYGGIRACFTGNTFTGGISFDDIQAGWTVTGPNGFADVISAMNDVGAGFITLTSYDWPGQGPYTFSSPNYTPSIHSPVIIGTNSYNWSFNNDGSLTLPGPINNIIGGAVDATGTGDPVYPTAIDVTKTINKLGDNTGSYYTLADGIEGQIMYLVPKDGATNLGTSITVAHGRVLNASGSTSATVYTDIAFNPFNAYSGDIPNVVTMIFTDGAWQASAGAWD